MTKNVIVTCYAIEPGKGSEQGSGFNFVRELAGRDWRVLLVTRKNNVEALVEDPAFSNVRIIGHDVPRTLTFWKRKGRGIIAYYYLWQWTVGRRVSALIDSEDVAVVHNYNFHTDWAPHFIRTTSARVIWGPICHQPRLPGWFLTGFGRRTALKEAAKWLAKRCFWGLDPNLRKAISSTDVILYANHDVATPYLAAADRIVYQTFGGASFLDASPAKADSGSVRILHVGRSTHIKGAHIALHAFQRFLRKGGSGHFELIGEGPTRLQLESLADELDVADSVVFRDWMDQDLLVGSYAKADAFLYPSLGNQDTVVAEALKAGLPVLCLEGSGTEVMAGDAAMAAPSSDFANAVDGLARHLFVLEAESHDPAAVMRRRRRSRERAEAVSWMGTANGIVSHYDA